MGSRIGRIQSEYIYEECSEQRTHGLIRCKGCQTASRPRRRHTTANGGDGRELQGRQDAAPLRDRSQRSDEIVGKILLQVIQCTYFVKEYCSERSFGMHVACAKLLASVEGVFSGGRLLRDFTSFVDQQAEDYIDSFQNLRCSLHEHASVSAAVIVHRTFGEPEIIGRPFRLLFLSLRAAEVSYVEGLQLLEK